MGLDSVELLVKVEEEFEISISDTEAERIITVGDFYETILNKIPIEGNDGSAKCKTQKIFYELRNVLCFHLDLSKNNLSPDTRINKIFSTEIIRNKWIEVESNLGLKLPKLLKPIMIQKLMNISSIIPVIILISTMIINDMNSLWLTSLIIILPTYFLLAEKLFDRYSIIPQAESMRELIDYIISLNYKSLRLNESNDKEVYWKLKGIISNTTGVPISRINYGARIAYDLGIE